MTLPSIRQDGRVACAGQALQSTPPNIGTIKTQLDAWAARGDAGEQRDVAVQRIKLCLDRPYEISLDLRNFGLKEAPPHWPPTLESLDLRGNRLKEFSTTLPDSLKDLKLSRNLLAEFSARLPDGLKRLDLTYNYLSDLPPLPASLEKLAAAKNRMTELPCDLPVYLSTDFVSSDKYARPDNRNLITGNKNPETAIAPIGADPAPMAPPTVAAPATGEKSPKQIQQKDVKKNAEKQATEPRLILDRPTLKEPGVMVLPRNMVQQTGGPQVRLNQIQRTGETRSKVPQLVMDSRFGQSGYARKKFPENPHCQFRLTSPLAESAASHQGASPFRVVEINNKGYAAHIEYPDGHCEAIVPNTGHAVHTSHAMHGQGFSIPLPPVINANIVYLPQATDGADHIAFTLSEFNADDDTTLHNTHYVPFSTYQQPDDTIIGIAYCGDPFVPYRFSVCPSDIPLIGLDTTVALTLATPQDIEKLCKFQELSAFAIPADFSFLANAVKLGQETLGVQDKFDTVFERSREMLDSAIDAKRRFPEIVKRILGKLTSRRLNDPKLAQMLETIAMGWEKMRDSMDSLESQKSYVVGLFEGGKENMDGFSQIGAMEIPVGFNHLHNAFIFLRRSLLMNPDMPLNSLAALLIHEFSHALLKTTDQMNPDRSDVYADSDHKAVDLSPIQRAAALKGSEPEHHAATFDLFTEMCSYLSDNRTRDLSMQYLRSPASHYFIRADNSLYSGKENKASPERSKTRRFADTPLLSGFARENRVVDKPTAVMSRARPSATSASVRLRS